jgi:hypothetical protein
MPRLIGTAHQRGQESDDHDEDDFDSEEDMDFREDGE